MNLDGSLLGGSLDQAEGVALRWVEPVGEKLDAVIVLDVEIPLVGGP